MKPTLILCLLITTVLAEPPAKPAKKEEPLTPGGVYRAHSMDRPRPRVMTPPTEGKAPSDAIVLFDGKDTSKFVGKDGAACPWKVENGELIVAGGDIWTKDSFASCQFHIEWKSDPNTMGNSQKKGNAGVFFMDRYETQILDCHNNPTYADGMAGCIYGQTPPLVNAVRPAGEWQTYDIIFTAPKLKGDKVVEPARITTIINGIVVQNNTTILGPTKHKQATSYEGSFPEKAPFRFQDHKNSIPNRLRNIWVRSL